MRLFGLLEKENTDNQGDRIFKEIIAENFPEQFKDMSSQILKA